MKLNKENLFHIGMTLVLVVGGVLIANNFVQPMINARKVSAPATV